MSTSPADDLWNGSDKDLSKDYVYRMQNKRFEVFKEQDLEKGDFDVKFDIGGKIIYANKFILKPISQTLNSWLSDRWTTKDAPIKIESYSYDNFYELLRFIYSGYCKLTNENVFQLVDMAEFFGVPCLKEFCDQFLSDIEYTAEKIEEMYEVADKYSLPMFTVSIKCFIRYCKIEMFKDEKFCKYKKPFVEFLSTINRKDDYQSYRIALLYYNLYGESDDDFDDEKPSRPMNPMNKTESEFFEHVYKWAEHQVMKQKPVNDENFNLQEAIKVELESILPHIKFPQMNLEFLMDFVVEKGFILSPNELCEFFKRFQAQEQNSAKEEDLFKSVYELAENQAMKKKAMSPDAESFHLGDSIKDDLAEVIPHVKFCEMDKKFLNDFVVGNGIITTEQFNHVWDTRVQIKNNGKIISGVFKDASWGYAKDKLIIKFSNKSTLENYRKNDEWALKSVRMEELLYEFDGLLHSEAKFHIEISRKPLHYVISLIFPCYMICVLGIAGLFARFSTRPERQERFSLGVMALVSVAVYGTVVAEKIPHTSKEIPLLLLFFLHNLVILSIATICAGGVLFVNWKGCKQDDKMPPKWITKILFCSKKISKINGKNVEEKPDDDPSKNQIFEAWGIIADRLDMILFLIFFLTITVPTYEVIRRCAEKLTESDSTEIQLYQIL